MAAPRTRAAAVCGVRRRARHRLADGLRGERLRPLRPAHPAVHDDQTAELAGQRAATARPARRGLGSRIGRRQAGRGPAALIADAHNDLLLELVLRRDEPNPFATHWLPKLRAGGVGLQVCALYAADTPPGKARGEVDGQLEAFRRLLDENSDDVFQVRTRAELAEVSTERLGLILSMEGVEALEGEPDAFADFWDQGVRLVGLTHNPVNAFAGGISSPEQGLTDLGRRLVDDLTERGAVIDLAHASPRTFAEILERAPDAIVIVSHACCRALRDIQRNLSDDQLRMLADRDGFLGVMALALTVGAPAKIQRLLHHLEPAGGAVG